MLKAYSNWLVELLFTIKCITSLFSSVQLYFLSISLLFESYLVDVCPPKKKRPQNLGLPLTPNRSTHHESNNRLKAVPGLFWGIETTEKRMRFFHFQKLKANLFLKKVRPLSYGFRLPSLILTSFLFVFFKQSFML